MSKRDKKGSYIVTIECVVRKEVICENCTAEQARADPWDFAEDEHEIDQMDWNVLSVEPNE